MLDCYYPLGGDGLGTSGSSGSGNCSADSLIDPETFARLVREHGEDVAMPFDWGLEIGSGFGGDVFGQA